MFCGIVILNAVKKEMFRFAQHDGKLRSVMIKLNMTNGSFSTLNMKKGNAQNYNIARKPSILSSCVALLLLQARFVIPKRVLSFWVRFVIPNCFSVIPSAAMDLSLHSGGHNGIQWIVQSDRTVVLSASIVNFYRLFEKSQGNKRASSRQITSSRALLSLRAYRAIGCFAAAQCDRGCSIWHKSHFGQFNWYSEA